MLREFYCQYYVFMIRARGSKIEHMSLYYISSLRDQNTIRSIKYNNYEFKKTEQTWNNICRDICAGIMGICQLRSHHGHEPHGRWHVDIWHEWHLVSMLTNIITSVIFPALWLKKLILWSRIFHMRSSMYVHICIVSSENYFRIMKFQVSIKGGYWVKIFFCC